jgi:hypothetical protein
VISPTRTKAKKAGKPKRDPAETARAFGEWYAEYPKHVARPRAEKAFAAAIEIASVGELILGARAYAESVRGKDKQYIAHPATWLRDQRWQDQPVPASREHHSHNGRRPGGFDHLYAWATDSEEDPR